MKTSTLYAITAEVTELNKGKKEKDVVYFQPGDNYESRIAKTKTVCEYIVPRFKTLSGLLIPLEKILLQPVLKSFIKVFIQYDEGLENKLTKAPLLGLAKSILSCYQIQ